MVKATKKDFTNDGREVDSELSDCYILNYLFGHISVGKLWIGIIFHLVEDFLIND